MNRRDEIKKIWRESFADSHEYVDMYFNRVYRDEDAVTIEIDDHVVSSLLLQPYRMSFHHADGGVGVSYIAGASTRKSSRGHGYMSQLIKTAIIKSRERGDMICTLIPAEHWLYFYYARFGFSTVFYVDKRRYTDMHTFEPEGQWEEVADFDKDEIFEKFHQFELDEECSVIHSRRDFENILEDIRIDNGRSIAIRNIDDGMIHAIAWAVKDDSGMLLVKKVMADDYNSGLAVMAALRRYFPDCPVTVMAKPDQKKERRHLFSHAMGRIVNVKLCLDCIARNYPEFRSRIRIKDALILDNSHIYKLYGGKCEIDDKSDNSGEYLDFDVDIQTFTSIVFSSSFIGDIIDFPVCRPDIYLMLD